MSISDAFGIQALPHPGHPKIAKKLFKVPVMININDSRMCTTRLQLKFWIIAKSAVEAANWARDRLQYLPETEIWAWGPKGGEVYRYVGWESAISASLFDRKSEKEIKEGIEEVIGQKINWENTNLLI